MNLFEALGFEWDRSRIPPSFPTYSTERVCFHFHRILPEFVWDASVLEGNPFTFPEVKTLLDGITVGGRRIQDQEQILNLAASAKELLVRVRYQRFCTNKETFCALNALVARNESLEWGCFRGEGAEINRSPKVRLAPQSFHHPPKTEPGAPRLYQRFQQGLAALDQDMPLPLEQGFAFFLFGALHQFFFDGNKRTSRLMMNGILMTAGIDALSVPAERAKEFNDKMIRFYSSQNATEMMDFLLSCHPDGPDSTR